jgi:hypothetical protein
MYGMLPPANGRADNPPVLHGYIVGGTSTWDRNERRKRLVSRVLGLSLFGAWRST